MITVKHRSSLYLRLVFVCGAASLPALSIADHPTLGLQQEGAGSITTLTAITLPRGASTFGIESQYLSNNTISDHDLAHFAADGEEVHSVEGMHNLSLNAAWGVSDRLTLGINLPYVARTGIREGEHHHEEEGVDEHAPADADHAPGELPAVVDLGDSKGIGDLTLYGQYRFMGDRNSRTHAALMFGLKAPTGKTDVISNEGGRFETEHQPGSGSWDGLAGVAFTRQWSKVSLDSNVLYAFAGNGAQQSNMGDVFNYNLALSYRVSHAHEDGAGHHHHDAPENSWDLALELNGEWRDYVTVAGERQVHTGGNMVYLSPSVRFNSRNRWAAYASLGVPVAENLNGFQSDPKFRLFIGISAGLGARQ